jgi:segregation and condensation protein B
VSRPEPERHVRGDSSADRGNDLALVEAALFLATRPLTRRGLAKILGEVALSYVDQLLEDLSAIYVDSARGIELHVEEGRALLRVKRSYVDRVAHLAPQQDIPQPVLRTLAVIAYNHPMTQADVVRVRGNKAYEHIQNLVERGLVRSEEHGRTLLLHVTDDFLHHFGLSTIEEFRFHVAAPSSEQEPSGVELQEVDDE